MLHLLPRASASIGWRGARRSSAARSRSRTSAASRASAPTRPARSPRGELRLDPRACRAAGVERARLLALAALASRPESGDPLDVAIAGAARAASAAPAAGASRPFPSPRTAGARPRWCATAPAGACSPRPRARPRWCSALHRRDRRPSGRTGARAPTLADGGPQGDRLRVAHARRARRGPAASRTAASGSPACSRSRIPCARAWPTAIARCREARASASIMVTGDHPATARAVAREIGLGGGAPTVITGDEIETPSPRATDRCSRSVDVIARALPAQKLRARARAAGGRRDRRGHRRRRERRAGAPGGRRRHRDGRARHAQRARGRLDRAARRQLPHHRRARSPRGGSSSSNLQLELPVPAHDPHPARAHRRADPARRAIRCSTCRSTSSGSSSSSTRRRCSVFQDLPSGERLAPVRRGGPVALLLDGGVGGASPPSGCWRRCWSRPATSRASATTAASSTPAPWRSRS